MLPSARAFTLSRCMCSGRTRSETVGVAAGGVATDPPVTSLASCASCASPARLLELSRMGSYLLYCSAAAGSALPPCAYFAYSGRWYGKTRRRASYSVLPSHHISYVNGHFTYAPGGRNVDRKSVV